MTFTLPAVPVSNGALLFDGQARLLVVKPNYKKGWTIPGGIMEADGETPWEGCCREVREEVGVELTSGRLVVVDTKEAKNGEPLALRFLFHGGTLSPEQIAGIRLQEEELDEYRFVPVEQALTMLRTRIARRVALGVAAEQCVYAQDGHRVPGVS